MIWTNLDMPMVLGGDESPLQVLCSGCLGRYPTPQCRHVDVSVNGRTLRPSVSALDEYHIPRVNTCCSGCRIPSHNLVN